MTEQRSDLSERILDLMADGKPWRSKHLIEQAADGLKPQTVRREIGKLFMAGRLVRQRHGVWLLPGAPMRVLPLRPFGPQLDARAQRILGLLDRPEEAPALAAVVGVSYQRIDQILKALLARKIVIRFRTPDNNHRWWWVRADGDPTPRSRAEETGLSRAAAKLLNALAEDALHRIQDLAAATGTPAHAIAHLCQHLEAQGRIVNIYFGRRRFVGITQEGLAHPARQSSAPRMDAADLSKVFADLTTAVIETLAILGEARAIDISGAVAGRQMDESSLFPSQRLAHLARGNLVERAPGSTENRPVYRLTDTGRRFAALIARHRPPPSAEATRQSIMRYETERIMARRRSYAARKRSPSGPGEHGRAANSTAQYAVLDALTAGSMATTELVDAIGPVIRNPKSIRQMLSTLSARGAIRLVGTGPKGLKVWALAGGVAGV